MTHGFTRADTPNRDAFAFLTAAFYADTTTADQILDGGDGPALVVQAAVEVTARYRAAAVLTLRSVDDMFSARDRQLTELAALAARTGTCPQWIQDAGGAHTLFRQIAGRTEAPTRGLLAAMPADLVRRLAYAVAAEGAAQLLEIADATGTTPAEVLISRALVAT
jgi:hypothetical protein